MEVELDALKNIHQARPLCKNRWPTLNQLADPSPAKMAGQLDWDFSGQILEAFDPFEAREAPRADAMLGKQDGPFDFKVCCISFKKLFRRNAVVSAGHSYAINFHLLP